MSEREETVAERVRAVREALPPKEGRRSRKGHLNQDDFAELLGVSRTRVIAWERGKAVPEEANRLRLANLSQGRYTADDFAAGPTDTDIRKLVRNEMIAVLREVQFPRLEELGRSAEDHFAATNRRLDALEDQLRSLRHRQGAGGES